MSKLQDYEIIEMFDDFLNGCCETVSVAGLTFDPATVIRDCDPIAYRVYMADWEACTDCPNDCGQYISDCECEE
jgi:hypothetical protein